MIHSVHSSKVLLVAGRTAAATDSATVLRRFRLARLRLDGRPAPAPAAARAAVADRP
ncbi:MAG: hypothetical protein WCB67_16635 [Solirubrobacteraceae bacterium]